jgi:hypothetical protein
LNIQPQSGRQFYNGSQKNVMGGCGVEYFGLGYGLRQALVEMEINLQIPQKTEFD